VFGLDSFFNSIGEFEKGFDAAHGVAFGPDDRL
jgi:hypothetical protein